MDTVFKLLLKLKQKILKQDWGNQNIVSQNTLETILGGQADRRSGGNLLEKDPMSKKIILNEISEG